MKNIPYNEFIRIINSPVSKSTAERFLSNSDMRDDFLMKYLYFLQDSNKEIYKKWIIKNLDSNKNVTIEHIFLLSGYIKYYSKKLILKADYILENHFYAITKLAILDYLMLQYSKIKKDEFIRINSLALRHSKNDIVNFQSLLNLCVYETEKLEKVEMILQNQKVPTLYYRLANQIDLLPSPISQKSIIVLKKLLKVKDFSQSTKKEINKILLN